MLKIVEEEFLHMLRDLSEQKVEAPMPLRVLVSGAGLLCTTLMLLSIYHGKEDPHDHLHY